MITSPNIAFGSNKSKPKVIEFAKLFRLKMKSKSNLNINKNPDMREKKYLDLDSRKSKKKMGSNVNHCCHLKIYCRLVLSS